MRLPMAALLIAATALSGCATIRDSRVNPFNWFGGAGGAPVTAETGRDNPLIPQRRASIFFNNRDEAYRGSLVAGVSDLRVERVQGGAVIRATGVARSLGAFDVRLIKDEAGSTGTTLSYELRALQPRSGQGRGTDTARTVTVAEAVTEQELLGIRTIRVVSAGNVRTIRR